MTRISTKLSATALAFTLALAAWHVPSAQACGFCHGDKIAAVYDAGQLAKAKSSGLQVAYAEVTGSVPDDINTRDALRRAIAAERAVDKASIRVSSNPVAVSFAFNPKKANVAKLLESISKRFGTKQWSLKLIKIVE